jgi:hypothetical protein
MSTLVDSYTDSIDGTLVMQETSIQNSMETLDKRAASARERE